VFGAGLRQRCEHRVQWILLCAAHVNEVFEQRRAALKRDQEAVAALSRGSLIKARSLYRRAAWTWLND
jgi:hypothetical protein